MFNYCMIQLAIVADMQELEFCGHTIVSLTTSLTVKIFQIYAVCVHSLKQIHLPLL